MAKSNYLYIAFLLALTFGTDNLINQTAEACGAHLVSVISVHMLGTPNAYVYDAASLLSWCAG